MHQPPLVVTNPQMMQMPVQNMGYAMPPQNNFPQQYYAPAAQYTQNVVQPSASFQVQYNPTPGHYSQTQVNQVRQYMAPMIPQGGPVPHSVITIANQQTMGQPYAQPVMYPQQQQQPPQRGPRTMSPMQQVPVSSGFFELYYSMLNCQ
jgi:hypothetical protein